MSVCIYRKLCFLLIAGCALLAAQPVLAQREVLYSQYLVNPLSINPAYAGSRESFHLSAFLRRKWISARAAPLTQSVSGDGAIDNGRIGLGFQALNDRMGLLAATGVYGSVAYRFNLPALAKLSVGVQGGVNVLPVYDFTSASSLNRAVGSFGVGIYYQAEHFFGGISIPEVVSRGVNLAGQTFYPAVRPIMVNVGTKLEIDEGTVLIPSILVSKIEDRPLGIDVNARIWFGEEFGLGLSYRRNSPGIISTNYLQALAEYQLTKSIRLGYIFNSQTPESPLSNQYYEKSVHEIMFRFSPGLLKFSY
ncbi:PorP/SprF family type IX secretion system membrane protein [Spirosoma oryzicola]|uniref:PorP/SprF family type IX secretion system membrane protein n=1 Tax=Spirosoma oryzicola TaxID=2898794 RepID=UPI001E5AC4B5|nr:PorP/SprF family type IX secretion system membrane protein [Spirosoma oryzicola]UHG90612.1 PorP/SprF family type IX secretion system membrane protein [Spirosoma oryzicola]